MHIRERYSALKKTKNQKQTQASAANKGTWPNLESDNGETGQTRSRACNVCDLLYDSMPKKCPEQAKPQTQSRCGSAEAGAGEGEGLSLGLGFCFLVMECSGVESQPGDTTWGTWKSLPRLCPRKPLKTPACHHFPTSCVLGQVLCPFRPQSLTSQRGCHRPPASVPAKSDSLARAALLFACLWEGRGGYPSLKAAETQRLRTIAQETLSQKSNWDGRWSSQYGACLKMIT